MRDLRSALARARQNTAKTTGDTGDSGDTAATPRENSGITSPAPVTSPKDEVVTLVTSPVVTSQQNTIAPVTGDANSDSEQRVSEPVTSVTSVTTEIEEISERAAIMEHDAGMPRAWADTFAAIVHGPCRFADEPRRWQTVIDGALRFADDWSTRAHALGWTAGELFGLDDVAPAARVENRGLAFLLGGGARVIAVDSAGADIVTAQGSRQRYYRNSRRAA